jgi:hypothetical protein
MHPQGSVKAKPSSAIGAALGPHLVLPNGNVSGPRACAPVEAFELPGSVAKGQLPAVPAVLGSATAGLAPAAQEAAASPGRCARHAR